MLSGPSTEWRRKGSRNIFVISNEEEHLITCFVKDKTECRCNIIVTGFNKSIIGYAVSV